MHEDRKLIKHKNLQKIHALFYEHQLLSKPQIAAMLSLSLPTVNANIQALLKDGLIVRGAELASNGGRPAAGYTLNQQAHSAVGVEIKFNQVRCALVNAAGELTDVQEFALPLSAADSYLPKLCAIIKDFLAGIKLKKDQLLGLGISVQAVIDSQGQELIYSRILPLKTLKAQDLSQELGLKVHLGHDVDCAALAELQADKELQDAFYLSISEHLGGVLIRGHQIESGAKGYAGALEHLRVGASGRKCYCGREDCLETYCALSALLTPKERLRDFFSKLRADDAPAEISKRWAEFLDYLAIGLSVAYLILERPLILGGDLAPYLQPYDLHKLESAIIKHSPFPLEPDFIRITTAQKDAALLGSALYFINSYKARSTSLLLPSEQPAAAPL